MIKADLAGKRTLVTGAASGIGLATAELFAQCGAKVALNDLPGNPALDRQVARLSDAGCDVLAAPGNVGDSAGCEAMVSSAVAALGGLDHLINNAGTPATKQPIPPNDLDALDDVLWDKLLTVNLLGPFRCSRAAAPALKESHGAIVNTASVAGIIGAGSSTPYATTKAGLINLTKALARGLAPEVRVNAVAPGLLDSNWECEWDPDERAQKRAQIPLQRIGEPADFAGAMLYLAADAPYVTGQTLVVDGGYTL
ncbi:MAG: SDR family oxidoreductase [Pseudomonadota bacterium]